MLSHEDYRKDAWRCQLDPVAPGSQILYVSKVRKEPKDSEGSNPGQVVLVMPPIQFTPKSSDGNDNLFLRRLISLMFFVLFVFGVASWYRDLGAREVHNVYTKPAPIPTMDSVPREDSTRSTRRRLDDSDNESEYESESDEEGTKECAVRFNSDEEMGITFWRNTIEKVIDGGQAAEAGVQAGWTILKIGGQDVNDLYHPKEWFAESSWQTAIDRRLDEVIEEGDKFIVVFNTEPVIE